MNDIKAVFREALVRDQPDILCSEWIIDRIPLIFSNDSKAYAICRQTFAGKINVDPSEIRIIGSAAFGVSLNPNKNYRLFNEASDIDVSVVSGHHFDLSWRALRNLGSARHRLSPSAQQSIKEHVERFIYWGTIATDRILAVLPFGKEWNKALEDMSMIEPTKSRDIKVRIYKDFQSLRVYHVNNIKNLRAKELEGEL